jgi:hypothetical protein
MRKLNLHLDAIVVDSFPTTELGPAPRGTVRGLDNTVDQDSCATCGATCATCPATCVASCPATCAASCLTCPASCACPSADGRC